MPGGVIDQLRISYVVDVADKATKPLLASERAVQRSVAQTARELARQDAAVKRSASVTSTAAAKKAAAQERQGRAAAVAAKSTTRLTAEERASSAASDRAAANARRITAAYNRQAAAAERAAAAEQKRARVMRTQAARADAGAALTRVSAGARTSLGGAATAGAIASRGFRGAGGGVLVGALGLGAAVAQTVAFDKAMRNVNSIAQLSEQQFKALGKSVLDLAGKTAQAPKTLAEGLYDLVSSGFDAKDSLHILQASAKAATAGLTDTATSTKAVAAVLNAYKIPASQAGKVSDLLFQTVNRGVISFEQLASNIGTVLPVASSLGVGLDQVGAALATMTKQGIGPEESVVRLQGAMTKFIKPSETMAEALKKVGVESGEQLIRQRGLQGAIEAVAGATDGSKASFAKLFPDVRAMQGALALTGKNARGAKEDLAAMRDSAGATGKALEQQSKSLSYQWNSLKAQASALSITVGSRLVPALGSALGAMNDLARGRGSVGGTLKDLVTGLRGVPGPSRAERQRTSANVALRRDAQEAAVSRQQDPSAATRTGLTIRGVIKTVADEARRLGPVLLGAGKQLVDAFKPAMPFLRNVLLPLLKGVGAGVIASVVGAFKIAVPIIKLAATALGFVGKAARPLRGVIQGVGTVIGFLAGGPILGLLSKIPKVGIVFRLLLVPLKLVTGAVGRVIDYFGKMPGTVGRLAGVAVKRVTGALGELPGKVGGLVVSVAKAFARLGRGIVSAIVDAIKSAPGAVVDAVKSLIPGPIRSLAGKASGAIKSLFGGRRGGRVPRYQGGGLVPIVASGGEMLVDGHQAMMIPGPSDRDGTAMLARPGAAILTADGQTRMAMGSSLGEALRSQAPHFRNGGTVLSPGQMASLAYRHGVRPQDKAIRMGAYGMRESHGKTTAHNYDPPRDDSWGLWQINVLPNANPRFKSWRLTDPDVNARAMSLLYKAAGEGPWGGYPESSITPYLAAARAGFSRTATTSGATGTLAAGRRRAGLIDDAFGQGLQAGQEGLTRSVIRREGNPILAAIRDANANAAGHAKSTGGRRGKLPSGVYTPSTTWNPRRKPIARWIGPYLSYGASHGWAGIVSSGFRTRAEQAAIVSSGVKPAAAPGTSNHEKSAFPGGAVDVTAAPSLAAALSKKPPPRLLRWAGAKDPVHFSYPHGGSYRRGGLISSYRAGGVVSHVTPGRQLTGTTTSTAGAGGALSGALRRALTFAGGSLEALDTIIGRSLESRLLTLRAQLQRQVAKGGPSKTIRRLQSAIDLIDFELGRRVGRVLDVVAQRTANLERGRGTVDRAMRMAGVSTDSSQGLGVLGVQQAAETAVRKQNVASLTRALRTATAERNRQAIRDITSQLHDAQDELAESMVRQVELFRDQVRALGAEAVNNAQFGVGLNQTAVSMIEAQQRLSRTQDTAAGMRERAAAIQGGVIPALAANVTAQQFNAQMLAAVGDVNGWRQAVQDAASAAVDLANAQADAADLLREAAAREAQDRVDAATHGRTMTDLGLQRLELEQQLIGTHDTAGGALGRADFIRQQILPAIQAEVDALLAQQQAAQAAGDSQLALQIGEAVYAKQNEVLQAQLDAQQQIADNTDALKEFSGSLAFSYRDQPFTDLDVNAARVGA